MKAMNFLRVLLFVTLTFSATAKSYTADENSLEEQESSEINSIQFASPEDELDLLTNSHLETINRKMDAKERRQEFLSYMVPSLAFGTTFVAVNYFFGFELAFLTTTAGAVVYGGKKIINFLKEVEDSYKNFE